MLANDIVELKWEWLGSYIILSKLWLNIKLSADFRNQIQKLGLFEKPWMFRLPLIFCEQFLGKENIENL